jgi:uncharacterized protein (TIGR01777 family)
LCASLLADGHEVVGLSRSPERTHAAIPGLLRVLRWSPVAEPVPAEAFDGVDAVVQLVGEGVAGRWTAAKKRRLYDSRVESTRNLVAGLAALADRPAVLVGGSAVGFYGERGDDELTESDPAGSDFLGRLTADWEEAATGAERLGVRVARVRTGLIVGPGSPFLRPMLPLSWLGLGGPMGSGRQWWPWVHLDDEVDLLRFAIEHAEAPQVLNATSPEPVRQRDFAKALGRVMRRPALMPAPAFAIRMLLGEFSNEVLTSKRVLPSAALAAGYTFRFTGVEAALKDVLRR